MPTILLRDERPEDKAKIQTDFTKDPNILAAQNKAAESVVLQKPVLDEPVKAPLTIQQDQAELQEYNKEEAYNRFNAIQKDFPSYTDYYKKTGKHIPGFEKQGEEKLRQERLQLEYKDVQSGLRTNDDFLMKNYGYDILAARGEDVKSAGYWYNKIMNNDSTNPLSNRYTTEEVLSYAQAQFDAEEFNNTLSSFSPEDSTTVKSLVQENKEATVQTLSDLYSTQMGVAKENTKTLTAILDAYKKMGQAIYTDNKGEKRAFDPVIYDNSGKAVAYLHTDGKLYNVSDDASAKGVGDNTFFATYKKDAAGNFLKDSSGHYQLQSLQDNGGILTTVRSITSGFLNVFADIGLLVGVIGGAVYGVLDDLANGGDFGSDTAKTIGDVYGSINEWKNSQNYLNNGYYDADQSSWSTQDIANTIGNVAGSLLGMIALGGIGGAIAKGGGAVGGRVGSMMAKTGNTLSRLSGLYMGSGGASGALEKVATGAITEGAILRTASIAQHTKTVATYFTKDFLDNVGYQNMRYNLDPEFAEKNPRSTLVLRSLEYAGLNAAISAVFAGGIDDSPTRRLQSWFPNWKMVQGSKSAIENYISQNSKSRMFADGFMDLIDNWATMSIDSAFKQDGSVTMEGLKESALNPQLALTAILMAGQTARGSAKRGINISGEIVRRSAPQVQTYLQEKVDSATDVNVKNSIQAVLDQATANRVAAREGKIENIIIPDMSTEDIRAMVGDNIPEGSPYFADVIFMETVARASSSNKVKEILDDTTLKARQEVFNQSNTTIKKAIDTVEKNVDKTLKNYIVNGYRKVTNTIMANYHASTTKAVTDFMKSNTLLRWYKDEDQFIESITLGNLFGNTAKADELLEQSPHLQKVVDSMRYVKKSTKEGREINKVISGDKFIYEISHNNMPDNALDEGITAAKIFADLTDDFELVEADNKIYICLNESRPTALISIAKRWSNTAAALKGINSAMTVKDIDALVLSIETELDLTNDPMGHKLANATVRTLDYLTNKGFITKKQAALMLTKVATDGDRAKALSLLPMEAKSNPTYKYYEGFTHITNLSRALTSGKLESIKKGDKKAIGLLRSLVGELTTEAGERADYEELFTDFPEIRQDIILANKAIQEGQSSPSALRQLIGNQLTKALKTRTPEAEAAIKKRFGEKAQLIDLKGAMEFTKNNPNKVVILFGPSNSILDANFKTAAEREVIKIALNHEVLSTNAKAIAESDDSGIIPIDVKSDLAHELSHKTKYIEAANGRGYITFDKNSDEFKQFAKDLGYDNPSYVLKQQGVINNVGNPYVVKVELTDKNKKLLDKSSAKITVIDTKDTNSFNRELGLSNSKGLVYIDPDKTILNIREILPILIHNNTIVLGKEDEGTQSTETSVKASVSAGQGKEKLMQTNYTSKVVEGIHDNRMRQALIYRDLLETLNKIESKEALVVPKDMQGAYLDKMGINPNYRGMTQVEKYFAGSIWNVSKSKDGSWVFELNKEILKAKTDQYKKGTLAEEALFRFIPLIVSRKQQSGIASGYLNKTGEQLFTVPSTNNQVKQLTNLMNTFLTNYQSDREPRLDLMRMLESDAKISNPDFSFKTEGLNIPASTTLTELDAIIKDLKKQDPKNIYITSLERMIEISKIASDEAIKEFKDPTVAILVTDPRFNNLIVSMNSKGDSENKILNALLKENQPIIRNESTIELKEDKSAYETVDDSERQMATRTVTSKLDAKNNLHETLSVEQVKEAIRILTEGSEGFKTANREYKEVDPGYSNLKVFQEDDGNLYIPVAKLPFLSDVEEKFIIDGLSTKEAQEQFNSRVKYFREDVFNMPKDFHLKVDSVVQSLMHPESTSVRQGGVGTENITAYTKNKQANVEALHAVKKFLYNNYTNARLSNNIQNLEEGSLGQKLNKLLLKELLPGNATEMMNVYDLNTKAGIDTMIGHIGETYDNLRQRMFAEGTNISDEVSNNIMDSAITIVANNKGGYFWNEYKNAFVVGNDGKIIDYSRSGHRDMDFNKMITSRNKKDLIGNKLIIPKEDTFEGISKPQFEILDLDDKTINNLKNNAILKAIEASEITGKPVDINNPEDIMHALVSAYARPIVLEDNYRSHEDALLKTGLDRDTIKFVYQDNLEELSNRFSDSSPNKVLELNDIFDTKNLAKSQRQRADAIVYGIHLTDSELDAHNNITKDINKDSSIDSEIENVNPSTIATFNKAMSNYIKELSIYNTNPRESSDVKLENAKKLALDAITKLDSEIDSNALIVDKAKAKSTIKSEQLTKAYLSNNSEGYVLKFLTDDSSDMKSMDTKQHYINVYGPKTIFDTETFNGKVFQASVTKGTMSEDRFNVDSTVSRYNTEVFTKEELAVMTKLANNTRLNPSDEAVITDKSIIMFAKNNPGYRQALNDFLKSNRSDMSNLSEDLTGDIIGFNTKGADLQWLKDQKIIPTKLYNSLMKSSIDIFNDIAMKYGIYIGETSRKNLNAIKTILLIDDRFKDIPELLADSHNAEIDNITTAYAFKYLADIANTDITRDLRTKVKDTLNSISQDVGIKLSDDAYEYANKYKGLYQKNSDGIVPHNTYDNNDANIRQFIDRYNAWNNELKYRKHERELDKILSRNFYLPQKDIDAIKKGGGIKANKMFNYIYSKLPAPDSSMTPSEIERHTEIRIEQAATILHTAINPNNVLGNNAIRTAVLNPNNYNDIMFESLATELNKRNVVVSADEIANNYLKATHVDESGVDITDEFKHTKYYQDLDTNEAMYLDYFHNIKSNVKAFLQGALRIDNEDLTNNLLAVFSRDISKKSRPDIGIDFQSDSVMDLVESYKRFIDKMQVEGNYIMATPPIQRDNSIELGRVQVSRKVINDMGIEIDGQYYLPITRDPAVVPGGFLRFMPIDIIESITDQDVIRMHETTAKMWQGDLDSDKFTVYKPETKAEVEYMKEVSAITNKPLEDATTVMDKAIAYAKGHKYNSPTYERINNTLNRFQDGELKKELDEDIETINSTPVINRKTILEQIKNKNIYKDVADELFLVVTTEKDSPAAYKVINANPFMSSNFEDRANYVKQSLAYKNRATYLTTIIGSLNKREVYAKMLTKTPLAEMPRESFRFSAASKEILATAIDKAIKDSDINFLAELGLKDIPEDIDSAVNAIESGIRLADDLNRKDPDVNKKFINAVKKFTESPEASSMYQRKLKAMIETWNKHKEEGLFDNYDYAVGFNNPDLDSQLTEHILQSIRDGLGVESTTLETTDRIGKPAVVAFVNFVEEGLNHNQDTMFMSDRFQKINTIRESKSVEIPKETYDSFLEALEKKKESKGKKADSIVITKYKDLKGNSVNLDNKVSIRNNSLRTENEKYYLDYVSYNNSAYDIKMSNLKGTGGKGRSKKEQAILDKFFNTKVDDKYIDMVFDSSLLLKKGAQLDNLNPRHVNINGTEYIVVDNLTTTGIDGNSFFDHSSARNIGTNNQLQSTLESPEGVWLLGDMIAKVNDKGEYQLDTTSISDMIRAIKNTSKTPYVQGNNMYYKLHMLQALKIAQIIKDKLPKLYEDNTDILSTNSILYRKTWGTQLGHAEIEWLKQLLVNNLRSSEHTKAAFNDIIKDDPYAKRIFQSDGSLGVTYNKVISDTQELDGKNIYSKSTKTLKKIPGYMSNTLSNEPGRQKGILNMYRTYGRLSPQTFYKDILGINMSISKMQSYAINERGVTENVIGNEYADNFNSVAKHLIEDLSGLENYSHLIDAADTKTAHEGSPNYSFKHIFDPNRTTMMEYREPAENFSLNIHTPKTDKYEVSKPNVILVGVLKSLDNIKKMTDVDIAKAFEPTGKLDNIRMKVDSDNMIIDGDQLRPVRTYRTTEGSIDDIKQEISNRRFSPFMMRDLEEESFKKMLSRDEIDRLNHFKSTSDETAIADYLKDFGKGLMNDETLSLSSKDQKFYRLLDDHTQAPNSIKTSSGIIKKEAFKANKRIIGEERAKTNYLNAAGFRNTEAGVMLNMGIPQAMEAGSKYLGTIRSNVITLSNMLKNKKASAEFSKYIKAQYLATKLEVDKSLDIDAKELRDSLGFKTDDELINYVTAYARENKGIASIHRVITADLLKHTELINKNLNEPFDTLTLIAPYIDKGEINKKEKIRRTIREMVYLKTSPSTMLLKNTSEDYIASVNSIISRLNEAYNSRAISQFLKTKGIISNNEIRDNIDLNSDEFSELLAKIKFGKAEEHSIYNLISVAANINPSKDSYKESIKIDGNSYTKEDLANLYAKISNDIIDNKTYGLMSTEDLRSALNSSTDYEEQKIIQQVIDLKDLKAGMIRDIAKADANIAQTLFDRLVSKGIQKLGENAILVDAYGREIAYGKEFNSLYRGSYESTYKDLAYQDKNEAGFKLNVIEEAVKGNVYYGNKTIADRLNKLIYIEKHSTLKDIASKIGKKTSTLIMMNPLRLPDRLLTFSMFDMAQGLMVDPMSWKYIPSALKTIRAYYQSNGKVSTPEWDAYLLQKGYDATKAKTKDVIVMENEPLTPRNTLFAPYHAMVDTSKTLMDYQSDFYRFAVFLSTQDKFKDNKKMNLYGPLYSIKDKIDNIKDQTLEEAKAMGNKINDKFRPLTAAEQKAYQVVANTYGNPGTFPLAAKKLSGLMVFNTFPLSFTRATLGFVTGGIKALEMAVRESDYRHLYQGVAPAALGLIGITLMYNLLMDNVIGEVYGMEDEDKEEWKKEQRTIAPVATMLFGTPVMTYDSFNPLEVLDDMTLEPIKRAIDDATDSKDPDNIDKPKLLAGAALRLLGQNAISRINPFVKIGTELATGYDLYGDDLYDTKYEYSFLENVFRKLGGLPLGASLSKAIVDAYALQEYNGSSSMKALVNGATIGMLNELGNTRAYKRGKSNYYRSKADISAQKAIENDLAYPDYEVEDLFNGDIAANSSNNDYNKEDASALYKLINKAMKQEEPVTTIYNILLKAMSFEGGGMSPDTVNSVLNQMSVIRRLNSLKDPQGYFNSLTQTQQRQLQEAIDWEEQNYPTLSDIKLTEDKEYLPYIPTHYSKPVYSNVYVKREYPKEYNAPYYKINSKYNKPQINRVSPKMGVWNN